jgi:anthranilate phosphoribosyltransferase
MEATMLKPFIAHALNRRDLTAAQAEEAMNIIMTGQATPAQIGAYLVALRMKGETVDEITGSARAMRANAVPVQLAPSREHLYDTAGTGGDGAGTFNISTAAAFVVAGTGRRVAKHGNRAASSQCGSADVLVALGLSLDLTPEQVACAIDQVGIGFLFAPKFHPAMKYAIGPRKEIGQRTIFNVLGPLTNPARPTSAMVGCFDPRMAPVMAEVFAQRGDSALVVRGEDGLDEFTTAAPTRVWMARDGKVEEFLLDAVELGLARSQPADLRGGEVAFNADVAHRLFAGERGPVRDAVLLNAAGAFAAQSGFPGDFLQTLRAGIERAGEVIDSGATAAQLERWVTVAQAAKAAE